MIPDFRTGRPLRRGLTYVSVGTSCLYCPTGYCTSRESHTRILLTSDLYGPYSPKDCGSNRAFFFSYTENTYRVVNTSSLSWATAPGYLLRRRSVWLTKTVDFPTAGSVKSIQYDKPSKDIVQLYKTYTTWHGLYLLHIIHM